MGKYGSEKRANLCGECKQPEGHSNAVNQPVNWLMSVTCVGVLWALAYYEQTHTEPTRAPQSILYLRSQ